MAKNEELNNAVKKLQSLYSTNQKGVAKLLGLTAQYLSGVINGHYPYNDELKQKISELCLDEVGQIDNNSSPCFDIATIQGGEGHGTGMEQLTPGMEVGRMLVPGLKTGSDIPYIQVKGDSMVNHKNPARSIPGGAWLGVKASTLNTVMWGEVYAIMTTDGPIVKKIIQSDKEGYIRCVSFNEEEGYAPFDLPCTDIIPPLYNIVGVVSVKSWE